MLEDRRESSSSWRRAHPTRHVVAAVLATLVVGLGRVPDVAADLLPFREPFVYTEAAAPYTTSTEARDLDVTLAPVVPGAPLVAKSAISVSSDPGNVAYARALANADGPRGFSAAAGGISASWSQRSPVARARSAMAFVAQSPIGEGRVRAILKFSAAVTAGSQLGAAGQSFARFSVEAGEWGALGIADRTPTGLELIQAPSVALPNVVGAAGFHSREPDKNASRLTIYANGIPVDDRPGGGPLSVTKEIVMNVPEGVLQVVQVSVTTVGNSVAYIDPVIVPHPDDPDVRITFYGAHDPTSPAIVFPSAEQLTAVGIDVGPLEDLGVLDAPEPPCTGGSAIASAKLDVREIMDESSKLRFRGLLSLAPPLDPPFDPVVRGARIRVEDSAGEVIVDDTVPGGAFDPETSIGWRHEPGGRRWVYTNPGRVGIRRVVLKRVGAGEGTYRFVATAYLPSSPVPGPDRLPLDATFVVDAPVARDGQCGGATFGGEPPAVRCPVQDGARLVCR